MAQPTGHVMKCKCVQQRNFENGEWRNILTHGSATWQEITFTFTIFVFQIKMHVFEILGYFL